MRTDKTKPSNVSPSEGLYFFRPWSRTKLSKGRTGLSPGSVSGKKLPPRLAVVKLLRTRTQKVRHMPKPNSRRRRGEPVGFVQSFVHWRTGKRIVARPGSAFPIHRRREHGSQLRLNLN